jgi:hypothetical protein
MEQMWFVAGGSGETGSPVITAWSGGALDFCIIRLPVSILKLHNFGDFCTWMDPNACVGRKHWHVLFM